MVAKRGERTDSEGAERIKSPMCDVRNEGLHKREVASRHGRRIYGRIRGLHFDRRAPVTGSDLESTARVSEQHCCIEVLLVQMATGHWEVVLRGTGALTTMCRTQLDLDCQISRRSRRAVNSGCAAVSVHRQWLGIPVVQQRPVPTVERGI